MRTGLQIWAQPLDAGTIEQARGTLPAQGNPLLLSAVLTFRLEPRSSTGLTTSVCLTALVWILSVLLKRKTLNQAQIKSALLPCGC